MTLSRSSVAVRGLAWSRSKKRRKSSSRFRSVTTFERKHGGEKAVFERPSRASSSESGVWRVPRRVVCSNRLYLALRKEQRRGFESGNSREQSREKNCAPDFRLAQAARCFRVDPRGCLFILKPDRPDERLDDRRPRHRRRGLLQRGGNDLRAALM